jgi:integrase
MLSLSALMTWQRMAMRSIAQPKKTGRPVRFELTDQTRQSIDEYLRLTGRKADQYLFVGRDPAPDNSTVRGSLESGWPASGSILASSATHSLRRTKAVLSYQRTGNLRAVQLLLGHSEIESTVR